jgi:hypothetical protein
MAKWIWRLMVSPVVGGALILLAIMKVLKKLEKD